MSNKLSEERKICEKKLAEEKNKIETQYNQIMKAEIAKMKANLSIIMPFDDTAFSNSTILTTDAERYFVRCLFRRSVFDCQVTRLYKATDPNVGFTAAKFHSLCNGKGPTLSLIKTVAGHIFGGFTTISWDSSIAYKNDTQSFLFSVDKQTKYPIVKNNQYAIRCNPSYGPTFGGGHDICVVDNSNSNKNS
jgi:hypothetical protein